MTFGSPTNPLLILDLANNHNGSVDHGKRVIDSVASALEGFDFQVAIKFQYRDLDSLIHPSFKGDHSFKYIKRFEETRLSEDQYVDLISHARSRGFRAACTPFDEASAVKVKEHGFDIMKIASASSTDWPLLDAVAKSQMPLVVSTGGLGFREMDRVAAFLSKRITDLAFMHCVALYPTPDRQLALNRIDFMKKRYQGVTLGYSTHETPENMVAGPLALAKGVSILERHVGLAAQEMPVNLYSSEAHQLRLWATHLRDAIEMMGAMDAAGFDNVEERVSLRSLRRGVYARSSLNVGVELTGEDVFFAIPVLDEQMTTDLWSKHEKKEVVASVESLKPLTQKNVKVSHKDDVLRQLVERVRVHFESAGVVVPNRSTVELSHHYGLERFDEFGAVLVTVINREYCKKVIGVFPGQRHPEHFHKVKEETFLCVSGTLIVTLDGEDVTMKPGDSLTVEKGQRHAFWSPDGAIFEEISSTHIQDDSFYTDPEVEMNQARKTTMAVWSLAE